MLYPKFEKISLLAILPGEVANNILFSRQTDLGFEKSSYPLHAPVLGEVRIALQIRRFPAGKMGLDKTFFFFYTILLYVISMQQEKIKMSLKHRRGFTLIELLVVVLIIAILAAVALPQYNKAVVKSRNAEMKQLVRMVAQAEETYYLAHGKYAANFRDLDIDIPLTPVATTPGGVTGVCMTRVRGTDAARKSDNFYIALNNDAINDNDMSFVRVVAYWSTGNYQCAGFGRVLGEPNAKSTALQLHCREWRGTSYYKNEEGAFCEKVEQASYIRQDTYFRYYL